MRRSFPLSRTAGLGAADRGLTDAEAEQRRALYGRNTIVEAPPSGWRNVARDTVRDPMIWFLAGTAVLFVWLAEWAEAAVLAVALLPIAGMDAYLHRRTQATTEGLSGRLAARAKVVRDSAEIDVAALDLVPGDLAIVAEGQPFPADGLIVAGDGLQVDESTLTGEAMPVRKRAFDGPLAGSGEIAPDVVHWGAAGTRLLTGAARLRVVYTGADTHYGQIVRSARAGAHERTPLQQAIGALVTVLVVVAAILCIALAGIRYVQGYGALDAVLSAVTLAVAALPEEFPIVFTFFLGVGVYRLAQRQALVRRAVVVENIGRVTCICTDKTGTLTEGKLHLAHRLVCEGVEPDLLLRVAATAARPESGDPLDALLLEAAAPFEGVRLATFPFTEDRRKEVALVATATGALLAAAKGAPETVLAMARLADAERAAWLAKTRELATTGHKVIACAWRRLEAWPGGEPDRDYDLVGLLAFEDPVREGVAEAVARARAAGIRVIMVTGDHPATAAAIAAELGIASDGARVIEGDDLAERLRRDGADAVRDVNVVARAIPAQKLDLVRALQRAGEIVAVTGDGVNDVPALQGADVGIAMGERGTRTAREVASIVLLDDNFRTIVRAIAEGRQLFVNLKLSFAYLLMVHAPLVATAALIPLSGYPLLYLPAHIVWLELIIHPTALLVFQQLPLSAELGIVTRRTRLRVFDWQEWAVVGTVGAMITVLVLFGYDYSLGANQDVVHARSMAMVALIIASATVTAALSGFQSRAAVVAVAATIGSAIVVVELRPLADVLHLSPLHPTDWLIAAFGGALAGSMSALIPVWQRRTSVGRDSLGGASRTSGHP
ncbi:MAG: cation-translocating P-type ATPase [Dongiaceae bacterium]